ncbi:MAG: hypothetical protein NVS3B25_07520 [Hymenobacter sp.]
MKTAELFIVMEDDGQPYEGSEWPIAGFTTEQAADAFATAKRAWYDENYETMNEQGRLRDAEEEAMPYSLAQEQLTQFYDDLNAKYPLAIYAWEPKHGFYVLRNPIPLNPTA